MTERIVAFPQRRTMAPGVYCEPLNIHFPPLYAVEITLTKDYICTVGLEHELDITPGLGLNFTLDPDDKFFGDVTWKPLVSLDLDEFARFALRSYRGEFAIIRHHHSMESAEGYRNACFDIHFKEVVEDDYCPDFPYKTDGGIFTLTLTKTHQRWPGPLLFYVATVPCDEYVSGLHITERQWAHIVAPGGAILDPKLFGY